MAVAKGEEERPREVEALRVFISYSRKDGAFTGRLANELTRRGYAPDFDHATNDPDNIATGIAAEDQWWQRLQQMIAASDVMVFVVSPDSAASKVCDEEIAWARGLGKRIIAILRRPVDFAKAPPRLSALNVKLDFTADDEAGFKSAADELARVLDTNVAWHRESTRLTVLLARWLAANQSEALLLSAADLDALNKLLEDRPREVPEPTVVLLELRDQSRARMEADRDRMRRVTGRGFVEPVISARIAQRFDDAARLMAAGAVLSDDSDFFLVPELWVAGASALCSSRIRTILRTQPEPPLNISLNANSDALISIAKTATIKGWHLTSASELYCFELPANSTATHQMLGTDSVAVGSADGRFHIINISTGKITHSTIAHDSSILSIAYCPETNVILTTASAGDMKIWGAPFPSLQCTIRNRGAAAVFGAFSADGSLASTISAFGLTEVWDTKSGRRVAAFGEGGNELDLRDAGLICRCAFTPDGKRILTRNFTSVVLWSFAENEIVLELSCAVELQQFFVIDFALSPDGNTVALVSQDTTVSLRSLESSKTICTLGQGAAPLSANNQLGVNINVESLLTLTTKAVSCVAFSPDGNRIALGRTNGDITQYDTMSGTIVLDLFGHDRAIAAMLYANDGKLLLSACANSTIRIWDTAASQEVACAAIPGYEVFDGFRELEESDRYTTHELVIVGVEGPGLGVEQLETIQSEALTSGQATPFDLIALFGGGDGYLVTLASGARFFWSRNFGAFVPCSSVSPHCLSDIVFSRNEIAQIQVSGVDRSTAVMKNACGDTIELGGHTGEIWWITFNSNEEMVVTASDDRSARIWDVRSGKLLSTLSGHAFSVRHAMFNSNGKLVITSSHDNTARIWDVKFGAELEVLRGHKTNVISGGISKDDRFAFTTSFDGTIRAWDLSASEAFEADRASFLCRFLSQGVGVFSATERDRLLLKEAPVDLYLALSAKLKEGAEWKTPKPVLHERCYSVAALSFADTSDSIEQNEVEPVKTNRTLLGRLFSVFSRTA